MPAPEEIRAVVERYVKLLSDGDVDGVLGLFGDDPRVEDPVGGDPVEGREAVHAFYGGVAGQLRVELTGAIRVAGLECAFPMLARLEMGGNRFEMDVIDVMRFDDSGRVESMRAFWSPGDMRPSAE